MSSNQLLAVIVAFGFLACGSPEVVDQRVSALSYATSNPFSVGVSDEYHFPKNSFYDRLHSLANQYEEFGCYSVDESVQAGQLLVFVTGSDQAEVIQAAVASVAAEDGFSYPISLVTSQNSARELFALGNWIGASPIGSVPMTLECASDGHDGRVIVFVPSEQEADVVQRMLTAGGAPNRIWAIQVRTASTG